MAEEVKGKWVTVRGAHVFIPDGETPDFSKGRRLQKTVKKENTKKGREDEEYNRLEDDINGLMKKGYDDEGTFLSLRARIIENLRRTQDPRYDVMLGKFERDAQERFGYTDEDMQMMGESGTHVKMGKLSKYNRHPKK